jgi:hypothetical protein
MAHQFKQGDSVFLKTKPQGLFTVHHVGTDGMIYILIDAARKLKEADESELEHAVYAVFTRIPEGWPIIIPVFLKDLYNRFRVSSIYRYECECPLIGAVEQSTTIIKRRLGVWQ